MTFAVLSLSLFMVVAISIDYARGLEFRTRLTDAADAAALAAVSPSVFNPALTLQAQTPVSQAAARAIFNAKVPPDVTVTGLTITIAETGSTITATVTYTATFNTVFGPLIQSLVTLGGSANASYTAAYLNIFVLVDTSQSMGLGADAATQTKMTADPKVNTCALACHSSGGASDTVVAAHTAGYKLRIDVVKSALAQVIASAQAAAAQSKATIKIGIYTFDNKFHTVGALSTDYAALQTAAAGLDIATYDAGSSIQYGLSQVSALLGTPGNGSSAATPLTFVMLMSDGLNNTVDNQSSGWWVGASTATPAYDGKKCWNQTPPPDSGPWYPPIGAPAALPCVPDPWTSTHLGNGEMQMMPIDPTWCQPIKTKGARLMTLYTQYALVPASSTKSNVWATNDWRLPLVETTIMPQLQGNMAACASKTSDGYVANDTASINTAVTSMFSTAFAAVARLTK